MSRSIRGELGQMSALGHGIPLQQSIHRSDFRLFREYRDRFNAQSAIAAAQEDRARTEEAEPVSNLAHLPQVEVVEIPIVNVNEAA